MRSLWGGHRELWPHILETDDDLVATSNDSVSFQSPLAGNGPLIQRWYSVDTGWMVDQPSINLPSTIHQRWYFHQDSTMKHLGWYSVDTGWMVDQPSFNHTSTLIFPPRFYVESTLVKHAGVHRDLFSWCVHIWIKVPMSLSFEYEVFSNTLVIYTLDNNQHILRVWPLYSLANRQKRDIFWYRMI